MSYSSDLSFKKFFYNIKINIYILISEFPASRAIWKDN